MAREGIRCPKCGGNNIVIRVTAYLSYQSENGEIFRTDTDIGEWDNESPAECANPACEYEAQARDFWFDE